MGGAMKHFLRIQFYDLTGYGDHIVVFVKASASSSPTVSYILNVRSLRATNFITRSLPLRVLSIKCYLHKCIIFEISIANKTCCITLLYSSASHWISYINHHKMGFKPSFEFGTKFMQFNWRQPILECYNCRF